MRIRINTSLLPAILHRGDDSSVYLKHRPRKVIVALGNGLQRRLDCRGCDGRAEESRLLAPVALAAGRDGSLYVGDFNYVRRLSPGRDEVASILQLRWVFMGFLGSFLWVGLGSILCYN